MSDDAWQEPNTQRWVRHVLDDMAPKLAGSAATISLVPDSNGPGEGDVKFWVELGAAIMLDKPIIAVTFDGRTVPERLRRVADEVVELTGGVSAESSEELAAAIQRVVGQ
jgi:hypothetical protein